MTSAKKPSGAIKQNYDKILVVTVLIALLISSVVLALRAQNNASKIDQTRNNLDATNPIGVSELDTSALDQLSDSLAKPYQLPKDATQVLVGELRVSSIPDGLPIPFDAEVCPFTGAPQPDVMTADRRDNDSDGLPDVWEEANDLNPYDAADAALDSDLDGFSNLEEFSANTDPNDASDTPPPPAKLRLVRVQVIPFELLFKGVSQSTDGQRFQLNIRKNGRTYFARMNEEIEGYKVIAYDGNHAEGQQLILERGNEKIPLIQGKVIDQRALRALMVYLVDGTPYRANVGETITLQGKDYKVVDIRDDRVVIRDEQAGQNIDIGRLSADERARLSGASMGGTAL